jgi:hypothetical protein
LPFPLPHQHDLINKFISNLCEMCQQFTIMK